MKMEELRVVTKNEKLEEEEDDFRSCCEDEDELKQREENSKVDSDVNLDEYSVKLYFKGVSVACPGDSGSRASGIGVVMENRANSSPIQVQKKLDFYVEEMVADYLALLDGLSLAIQHNIRRVFAFTDSEILYDQIMNDDLVESPLVEALRQRILEQARNVESFVLKFVHCSNEVCGALSLAQVAVGIVSLDDVVDDESTECCSICCEEKLSSMIFTIKCSHKFCSHCMKTYVEGKLQSSHVPIRCPQLNCKYCISPAECRSFLPVSSYESLEKALLEANILGSNKIYCPYPSCSMLLDSSSQCDDSCVECPVCERLVCVDCGVPWHSSMSCGEYQSRDKRWKRCQQCRRMIELTHGCDHMTCGCGHEFCYSCGADYRDGQQTCQCVFWDDGYPEEETTTYPSQQLEQWAWDSFDSLPMMMDAYSDQERSQLALIQRFLAGGFSFNDQNTYQSPSPPRCTDSYADAMKDLHQLPWLERFVSVISDNYYEDYIQ